MTARDFRGTRTCRGGSSDHEHGDPLAAMGGCRKHKTTDHADDTDKNKNSVRIRVNPCPSVVPFFLCLSTFSWFLTCHLIERGTTKYAKDTKTIKRKNDPPYPSLA